MNECLEKHEKIHCSWMYCVRFRQDSRGNINYGKAGGEFKHPKWVVLT